VKVKNNYTVYRQIGNTRKGEAIYKNTETGEVFVEKDFTYLVFVTEKDLEGAEIWN